MRQRALIALVALVMSLTAACEDGGLTTTSATTTTTTPTTESTSTTTTSSTTSTTSTTAATTTAATTTTKPTTTTKAAPSTTTSTSSTTSSPAVTTTTAVRLDPQQPPFLGEEVLSPGFGPDPFEIPSSQAGGPVDVSYLGGGCTGFAAVNPDLVLQWNGGGDPLTIGVDSTGGSDPVLVVRDASGTFHCDDDSNGLDPEIRLDPSSSGSHLIWVGTFHPSTSFSNTITISSTAGGAPRLQPGASALLGTVTLASGFTPDPEVRTAPVTDGPADAGYLPGCIGTTTPEPTLRLDWSAGNNPNPFLRIWATSSGGADLTLIVRDTAGNWVCDDDTSGTTPVVDLDPATSGIYEIWVGTYPGSGDSTPDDISITRSPSVAP